MSRSGRFLGLAFDCDDSHDLTIDESLFLNRMSACFRGLVRLSFALALMSCQSLDYAPLVTSQMSAVKTVDPATLRQGRTLFVHRCIECHTLPPLWHYRKEDWPKIVNSMSHRASLSPAERNAIISYILAVRAQD